MSAIVYDVTILKVFKILYSVDTRAPYTLYGNRQQTTLIIILFESIIFANKIYRTRNSLPIWKNKEKRIYSTILKLVFNHNNDDDADWKII